MRATRQPLDRWGSSPWGLLQLWVATVSVVVFGLFGVTEPTALAAEQPSVSAPDHGEEHGPFQPVEEGEKKDGCEETDDSKEQKQENVDAAILSSVASRPRARRAASARRWHEVELAPDDRPIVGHAPRGPPSR